MLRGLVRRRRCVEMIWNDATSHGWRITECPFRLGKFPRFAKSTGPLHLEDLNRRSSMSVVSRNLLMNRCWCFLRFLLLNGLLEQQLIEDRGSEARPASWPSDLVRHNGS